MYRILRVSSHPTIKKHGVGLHPFKISNSDEFETIFISPLPELGDNYIENTKHKLKISKVRFFKRPINTSNKKLIIFHLKRIYKIFIFSFFAIRQANINKVDIIHIHSPMYLLVALWGKITGKLTCITYHGTDYVTIKDNKAYQVASRYFLDIGFCISPQMVEKMKSNHKTVKYVPNGIDTNLFFNQKKKRKKILLAVGSLKKEKSHNNLIKAFKKSCKKNKDYELHIAGEGHLRSELELIVEEEGLKDKVHFCGNLDLKELINKYNSAECFILSSYTEGFPKVVLEAVFCGCKVVATDVGSVKTFLPEEYVIPNNSVANLHCYIEKIIKEDNFLVNEEELKSRYTWLNIIKSYREEYENHIRRS